MMHDMNTTYSFKQLRIVDNNTRDYAGSFTVEHMDVIVAGPYATKADAKQAKADLLAGRTVRSAG